MLYKKFKTYSLRKKPVVTIIAGLLCGLNVPVKNAAAHGTLLAPESRVYKCRFNGNPENHSDPACRAAIAAAGKQPIYDWNSIRQGNANGEHETLIPVGQLCSGGNSTFRGMDLLRLDWQTTRIAPDANGLFEFIYYATAPHTTRDMIFYITKDDWNPAEPQGFDDLEEFCRHGNVDLVDLPGGKKGYRMFCQLPNKSGRHLIYNIWQRLDSPEAFYACSDVEFSDSEEGDDSGDVKLLGTIVAVDPLPAGTVLTFRLLDKMSSDVEQIAVTLEDDQGDPALWPFVLAQVVNSESQFIRIGKISDDGNIEPSQQLNDNKVYSLSGSDFSFIIDKQIPGDDEENVDYIYPGGMGRYIAGTTVKGRDGNNYQCKPFPFSGWCNQTSTYYEPGTGLAWEDAWNRL